MDTCRQLDPRIIPFAPDRAGHDAPLEPRVRDWLATQSLVVEEWLDRLVAQNADVRLIALLSQHAAFLRETMEEG